MRLIKTGPYLPGQQKLEIDQKWGKDIPHYAVLSHTWSKFADDEVLLADVQNGTARSKPAFPKLWTAIEKARLDGYGWLWDDTCCIDKTSSVELSEAINSMYTYYANAQKCYAYLTNVSATGFETEFRVSRWWRRGWTLQELLAPKFVEFYSSEWVSLGTKFDLCAMITQITGIDENYLSHRLPVQHASIAKRMSWASSRETTREEDGAYSLIGLFEVNMAMLYGEGGKKAFLRLQEEIMRGNEDQSLFAWIQAAADQETSDGYHGLLADSPKDFQHTASSISYSELAEYTPSSMTARGLHMTLPLMQKDDGTLIAALRCPVPPGNNGWLAVYLKRLPIGINQYARVTCDKLASVSRPGNPQEVYIRQHFPSYVAEEVYPYHFFQLRGLHASTQYEELRNSGEYKLVSSVRAAGKSSDTEHVPAAQKQPWSDVPLVYSIYKKAGALTVAILVKRSNDGESFVLMLGSITDFDVGFHILHADSLGTFAQMQQIFSPQPAYRNVELDFHMVCVNVEQRTSAGQKLYFVDLEIEAFPQPTTVAEVLQDAMELATKPIFGADHRTQKAALKNKLKTLWTAA
ncbi:hypothetical protein LTR09_010665 [Extremus antarcticus]|uniref:Heterokaryon incompatibility domain-containing protein n=1 Tax=Extremus antarcticus TaxID=702011 RepID=A0AAJ0D766_9PEZI|nr:hypothetical protein LTR09_010665 [Extremus antarcticus]